MNLLFLSHTTHIQRQMHTHILSNKMDSVGSPTNHEKKSNLDLCDTCLLGLFCACMQLLACLIFIK